MWDLPGPGLEPVSPALAGGILTAAPPGKPYHSFLKIQFEASRKCKVTEIKAPFGLNIFQDINAVRIYVGGGGVGGMVVGRLEQSRLGIKAIV